MPEPATRPVTGPAWGAVPPEGADTALGLAARLGAYCWAEQQLFALLGGWAPRIPEPDVKLMVAEHADHAAWRARRWFELLPTAPPGPDALVAGPAAVVHAVAGVAGDAGDGLDTVERLAVAYRVLVPGLAAALGAHRDWSSPVTEPEVGRVLGLCLADLTTDWVAGERALQALAATDGLERAHRAAGHLEALVAAAGGLLGPGTTGVRPTGGGS